jgi:PAS domain S-box-containing protein
MPNTQHKPIVAEALTKAEATFGQLADELDLVFWVLSGDRRELLFVNRAFETLWEMPCAELHARPEAWLDRIHPDDLPRVRSRFFSIPSSGAAEEVFRLVLPSGKRRWIRDRGIMMRDVEQTVWIAGIAEDITEQRSAEIRLAVQHSVVKILSEDLPVGEVAARILEAVADPLDYTAASLWLEPSGGGALQAVATWAHPSENIESPTAHRFPIVHGERVFGAFEFAGPDREPPPPQLSSTLNAIARQLGLWLERDRLRVELARRG